MSDFLMPSLGADMEAGTLVEWLVKPGDRVKRGDVVAVVETQKGAIEVEIFDDGLVSEIVVPVGQRVPVGTVLARIGPRGAEAPAGPAAPAAPAAPPPPTARPAVPPPVPPTPRAPVAPAAAIPAPAPPPIAPMIAERIRITPAARRRAEELGLDVATLRGTGVDGSISLADVEAAARAGAPAPAAVPKRRAGFDPAAMRAAIAAAMSRSKREIPHYYLNQTVDLSAALGRLEALNRDRPPTTRLLPAALLLKAIALALVKVPELNGFWQDGAFRPGAGIHVGWAIALRGGGLVAPAIRDTDKRSLDELMAAMRDLVERARAGGLRSSELSDPTVTVTSLGERGAESVLPIIYPPQVASVGIGRVVTRPWVVDGAIGPRPVAAFTLAGDHRASDGHRGGLLLVEIERLLQEPETL
ncbi:MAG: dihydrolipoamide acetyltransferase family protein [Pseudomonadota bacterium]